MDLSDYPLETRARAALRLTDALLVKAQAGPREGASEDNEARRLAFLQVHPAVLAIAERRHSWRRQDPEETDPRPRAIEGLLRIAKVPTGEYAAEVERISMGEEKVLAEAYTFMATLPASRRGSDRFRREPTTVDHPPRHKYDGRMLPVILDSIGDANDLDVAVEALTSDLSEPWRELVTDMPQQPETNDHETRDQTHEQRHQPAIA